MGRRWAAPAVRRLPARRTPAPSAVPRDMVPVPVGVGVDRSRVRVSGARGAGTPTALGVPVRLARAIRATGPPVGRRTAGRTRARRPEVPSEWASAPRRLAAVRSAVAATRLWPAAGVGSDGSAAARRGLAESGEPVLPDAASLPRRVVAGRRDRRHGACRSGCPRSRAGPAPAHHLRARADPQPAECQGCRSSHAFRSPAGCCRPAVPGVDGPEDDGIAHPGPRAGGWRSVCRTGSSGERQPVDQPGPCRRRTVRLPA